MKIQLLIIAVFFMSQLVSAQTQTPEETARKLCQTRFRDVNERFDFKKCIIDGAEAFSQGKLAVAKKTCFSFENQHRVGRSSMIECMTMIENMDIPNSDSFNLSLKKCSQMESALADAIVSETTYGYADYLAKISVYLCMNHLF